MSAYDSIRLESLTLENLSEIIGFWRRAAPFHLISGEAIRERLFESPGAEPDLLLAARDGAGRLLGFVSGVFILEHQRFAGVRCLSLAPEIDPAREGRRVAAMLLDAVCLRLAERGVTKVRMHGTPPYYFRPGIDVRETGLIACLLDLGWTHEATYFNMTVDLRKWVSPGEDKIFGVDAKGYAVRRARGADRAAFVEYMDAKWNASWRDESLQAFGHEPMTLFLALKGEEIVGFAAYEVSQCAGGFGPTGVSHEHRGAALGQRTLWACLDDLQKMGRPVCEIGWVGPVSFYHRACGATLGPVYWFMTKAL